MAAMGAILDFGSTRKTTTLGQDQLGIISDPARIAIRTVKYCFAIANHCWILDYKWIEDSKQAGHLLPEEDYEIIGDSTTGTKIQRPKASRMTGSSLLTGYEVYCDEKSSKDIDTEIYKKTGIVTVVRDWVFDSLSLHSVQPLDEYKFTAEENMVIILKMMRMMKATRTARWIFFGCGDYDEKDPDYADLESESIEEDEYVSDSSGISELFPVQSVSKNSGDYKHNVEVLKNGTGTLVTWTRKDETTITAKEYLPCEDCLAFFLNTNLWRHRKICPFRKNDRNKKRLKSQASLLLPSSVVISEGLQRKVLSRMNTDEITMVVRNDPVILRIGEKLFQKHGHLPHLYPHVSQKMRELGRFLISVRKQDTEINLLSDELVPKNFPIAVNATRKLCGYVEENKYSNPSLALRIGHLLKKCAKAMSLISADTQSGSNADAFLTLCESEWSDDVSIAALQTLSSEKRNKGSILPLTEDITKIQRFLKEKSSSLTAGLEEKFSKQTWDMLNQVTLASVVLFSRRRGGETERITLKNYLDGKKNPTSSLQEIEDSLSPVEKMLCDTFERVEIRGKKGRTVPVLLTPCLIKNIDCLMKYREESGVSKENPYLFPRSSFESLNPIRSADCLRRFAQDARLEKPESLTSTQLRKHVATFSQNSTTIAKMGRLLTAFDNGTVSKYSGKTLDEIPVDDVEELQLDGYISSDDCFESDSDNVSGHQLFDCSKKGNGCSSSTEKATSPLADISNIKDDLTSTFAGQR
ncbi:uncharacterized protein LOC132564488 [Ylistrum balloti]|uniref:uncharacterized protein LOC132564488 n=1 Tax=Ylistrum balloti TaxID=509963 RepID=UPI002905A87C|nr:uncharacterized protein LOC132564488 [Ylistrum balloti]